MHIMTLAGYTAVTLTCAIGLGTAEIIKAML